MQLFLKLLALVTLTFILSASTNSSSDYLFVNGTRLYFRQSQVFLSGVNFAWNSYASDFGNGQYSKNGAVLEAWIKDIAKSGGNVARIWLHCEGQNTPEFNSHGVPTAPDRDRTLISDLSQFLDIAEFNNVFVILVLWNGAVGVNTRYKDLIMKDINLDAYLQNVLLPMVKAIKTKSALAAWEIMNEPEGLLEMVSDDNSCFDTAKMKPFGGGWTKSNISMQRVLNFINKHAATIKNEDPKALVTLGSWHFMPQTDAFPSDTFNYYKNSCLVRAGGEANGTLDFYQMHAYSWEGKFFQNSPFLVDAATYQLDKPLVIGEFSASCGADMKNEYFWKHAYNQGYNGILSWQFNHVGNCSDSQETQERGMQMLRFLTSHGHIGIKININNAANKLSGKICLFHVLSIIYLEITFS